MSFVPVSPQPTTPRARELAREIVRTVEDFRVREPRMRDHEVERAMMLARSRLGGRNPTLVLVAAGLVLLIAGLFAYLKMTGGR